MLGRRHQADDVTSVAREVACRNEVSTGLSERVLDPDVVNHLAVLQVLAEQAPACGRAGRTNDERIPERQCAASGSVPIAPRIGSVEEEAVGEE